MEFYIQMRNNLRKTSRASEPAFEINTQNKMVGAKKTFRKIALEFLNLSKHEEVKAVPILLLSQSSRDHSSGWFGKYGLKLEET